MKHVAMCIHERTAQRLGYAECIACGTLACRSPYSSGMVRGISVPRLGVVVKDSQVI